MQKNVEKMDGQQINFFRQLTMFGSPTSIFSHFWSQNRFPEATFLVFFFENGDFVKIVLPL